MARTNHNSGEDFLIGLVDNSIRDKERTIFHEGDILTDMELMKNLVISFEKKYGHTRPQMGKFVGFYSKDEIMKDHLKAQDLDVKERTTNSGIDKQKKLVGKVFENIVIQESMEAGWLGRDANVIPTCIHDDNVNKVDALAEIHSQADGEEHYLGLAMDVTFSKDDEIVIGKMNYVKNNILKGYAPAIIKYPTKRGVPSGKMFIPKVIIGADAETVRELVTLMQKVNDPDERVRKQAKHELNFHPFQTKMLMAMEAQIKAYMVVAKKSGNARTVQSYFKADKILQTIVAQKSLFNEQKKSDAIKNDLVLQNILEYAKQIEQEVTN